MSSADLREKAERLRALHVPGDPLVLCNVWDAASARAVAGVEGTRAIATGSHPVSAALGYPDGQVIGLDVMLAAVERIARAVDLPVTADLEAGYGDAAATARGAIEAGAVGLNLEDADHGGDAPLVGRDAHAAAVAAVREVADRAGVPLVINARTDVFLRKVGDEAERFDHAVERANAYRAAGADCLFLPGVADAGAIGRLARAIDGPINVFGRPGGPSVPELAGLGVARVSTGPQPLASVLRHAARIAEELLGPGTYEALGS